MALRLVMAEEGCSDQRREGGGGDGAGGLLQVHAPATQLRQAAGHGGPPPRHPLQHADAELLQGGSAVHRRPGPLPAFVLLHDQRRQLPHQLHAGVPPHQPHPRPPRVLLW